MLDSNLALKSKLKIKYNNIEAYEVRMIEDVDDHSPNLDFAALDDQLNLIKSGHRILVLYII